MKCTLRAMGLLAVLMLFGCQYNVPVVPQATVPVDAAVFGVWEPIAEEGEEADDGNLLILRFSDTEYLIVYPTEKNEMYYRAYLFELEGTRLVQLQWLGHSGRPLTASEKPYHVCRYTLADDVLTVQMLNGDVVSPAAATSQELMEALVNNAANSNLFHAPGRFRRSSG